jgi:protein TonB
MTPTEILRSSALDILFENRNHKYGAYTLRKFYNNRLAVALLMSVGTALLLLFLAMAGGQSRNGFSATEEKPGVVLTDLVAQPPEVPPAAAPTPPLVPQPPSLANTTIDIRPDNMVTTVPTIDALDGAIISTVSTPGTGGDPGVQPVPPGTGTSVAPVTPAPDPQPAFVANEKEPEFPGGAAAWAAFLNRYLQMPEDLEAGDRKSVSVRFWVGTDGSVTNFQVVQSGGRSFDNEVIRVLKKMPKWRPAIQNGHAVATGFTQPVTFTAVEQ